MGKALSIAALAVSLLMSSAVAAQDDDSQDPQDDPQASPPATTPQVEEYVYVEGGLPYVPRSNTVVTKLPLERRLIEVSRDDCALLSCLWALRDIELVLITTGIVSFLRELGWSAASQPLTLERIGGGL